MRVSKVLNPKMGTGSVGAAFAFTLSSQLTARLTFRIAQGEEIFAQLDAHTYYMYVFATGKLIGRLVITPYYL